MFNRIFVDKRSLEEVRSGFGFAGIFQFEYILPHLKRKITTKGKREAGVTIGYNSYRKLTVTVGVHPV